MGDSIGTKLHIRAKTIVRIGISKVTNEPEVTHFFIMMYRKALPRVWPSSANSNEAAVAVEPASYGLLVGAVYEKHLVVIGNRDIQA